MEKSFFSAVLNLTTNDFKQNFPGVLVLVVLHSRTLTEKC